MKKPKYHELNYSQQQIKKQKKYSSSLSSDAWRSIRIFFKDIQKRGRKPKHAPRSILNAIFYILRTGCQWRMLPLEFPPWQTVYSCFRRWSYNGLWKRLNDVLRLRIRKQENKKRQCTAAIIDSQSVKTTEQGGIRGYDAGKKIKGRKRHIVVDTMGLLLNVKVHSADIQDRDGAKLTLENLVNEHPELALIWADGGYSGALIQWVDDKLGITLEIIKRSDDVKGFKILPRRWVVERTLAWICRNRRMSKDYERFAETQESWVYLGMISLMMNRLDVYMDAA